MYEQFFNFMGLREDPFHVSPDPRFYYSTSAHESALAELLFGLETRKGLLVLTGEAGTGKTSILNQILEWLQRRGRSTAYIFHTHVEPIGLLRFILAEFGVPCASKAKSELVSALHGWLLQRHAAQDLPVLILDEAQGLPVQTLDELRLLLNLETPRGKLLQVILSGQPKLDEKLRLPALKQLRQRVMFHSRLPVLTQKETAAYISSRLATAGCTGSSLFPDEAVRDIYTSSHGIPRVVNLLCEHALISAYGEQQRVVSPEMVRRIAADFELLANPLAGTADMELRPSTVRLVPFPVIDEEEEAAEVVAYAAEVGEAAAAEIVDAPVVAAGVAVGKPLKSWRRHRDRFEMGRFARDGAETMRDAWRRLTEMMVMYVGVARWAVHRAVERPRAKVAEQQWLPANWCSQIEFDISKHPQNVTPKVAPDANKEEEQVAAVGVAPAAAAEVSQKPTTWRRHRERSSVAAFVRKAVATVREGWRVSVQASVSYVRSVYRSFVRDMRIQLRGLNMATPAFETGSTPQGGQEKGAALRNVWGPIVRWLRQPLTREDLVGKRAGRRG